VENRWNWKPEELTGAHERMMRAARAGDIGEWTCADLDFHRTVWRLGGNPFLEKALGQVCMPFFAFSEIVFQQRHPKDLVQQGERHRPIVEAVLHGDKEQARDVMREVLLRFAGVWLGIAAEAKER
jgi:DNA-binding GntR family transcriptional regulator